MALAQPRVDHVVLDTRDRMDEAVIVYRSLGFQLTERGRHTLGSINHLIVFESDYLELLGFDAATGAVRSDIAHFPTGLNGLVFAAQCADSLFHDLKANVPLEEPLTFSRLVKLPDGHKEARFRVVRLKKGTASFGRVYFCQHLTPELVWRPECRQHPNGALSLAKLSIAVRDSLTAVELFERMFGTGSVSQMPGACRLAAGAVEIEFLPLDALQTQLADAGPLALGRSEFIARLSIRTASIQRTTEVLCCGGVPFVATEPGRLLVPASAALNVALEFIQ